MCNLGDLRGDVKSGGSKRRIRKTTRVTDEVAGTRRSRYFNPLKKV